MHSRPVYLLWVGALIGTVIAVAGSSAIALSMFATDCPWPTLWRTWGKLLVLTIPTCSATVAAALLIKYTVPKEVETPPVAAPLVGRESSERSTDPPAGLTLAEKIVQSAYEVAEFYYVSGQSPTRRLFEQEKGMTQALWGSARDLLQAAGIVGRNNNAWAEEPWTVIESTLDKMHADYDRVWIRPLGSREMISVFVSEQLVGNRYTAKEGRSAHGQV